MKEIEKKENIIRKDMEPKKEFEQKAETKFEKKEFEKKKTTKTKDQISVIKNFIGKDVAITLRNGNNLKGKLETVTQYELVLTVSYEPMVVMKHAIDYLTLAGEK